MKKLTFAVCALLGYAAAASTKTKNANFGDTLKKVQKGTKLDSYINQIGQGGRIDSYVDQLGKGGQVDDYASWLKDEGAGDVGEYFRMLKGAKGNIKNYLDGLGNNYDDIIKGLKGLGMEGTYSDYESYMKDYKGDYGNIKDLKDIKK